MIDGMVRRIVATAWVACCVSFAPTAALAQDEEAADRPDGRFMGYTQNVALEPASPAGTWFLFAVAGGLCVAVMFKNSKRSHLD